MTIWEKVFGFRRSDLAEQWALKTLQGRKAALDPTDLAESYIDLAILQSKHQGYEEAEKGFLKGVEIQTMRLGRTHPKLISAYNSLADLYSALGKYEHG